MSGLAKLIMMAMKAIRSSNGAKRANSSKASCVACGSTDVLVAGGKRLCLTCQYEGQEDGGGDLTREEVAALYKDEGGGVFR